MIYLDISAAVKLIRIEAESTALARFIAGRRAMPLLSSAVLYPEIVRAVSRVDPALVPRAVALVQRMLTAPIAPTIVQDAATIGSPLLRTLDALHLATAAGFASQIDAFVTYDKRLAEAAGDEGLPVEMPS